MHKNIKVIISAILIFLLITIIIIFSYQRKIATIEASWEYTIRDQISNTPSYINSLLNASNHEEEVYYWGKVQENFHNIDRLFARFQTSLNFSKSDREALDSMFAFYSILSMKLNSSEITDIESINEDLDDVLILLSSMKEMNDLSWNNYLELWKKNLYRNINEHPDNSLYNMFMSYYKDSEYYDSFINY